MKIETINIKDIKIADYNPRLITIDELERLENSINEFGLVDPIIVNLNNNTIIGGHQRYKILKKQNIENLKLIRFGDIGWVFTDENLTIKDKNHEKALNIALNKISGDWDTTKLNEILEDLKLSNFDVELTGFDETELTMDNDIFSEDFNDDEDDFNFFDEIEDDEDDDEIILRKNNTTINIGSFTIILSSFKFNQWLRRLEYKNNFINNNIKKDIMRRIGFEVD